MTDLQAGPGAQDRVLVAGIGNIFCGDDGFGCEVAAQLERGALPGGVHVADYGIRGMHLAYDLAGYDRAVLVDAMPGGGAPGTLYVVEPGVPAAADAAAGPGPADAPVLDAHGMQPDVVLGMAAALSGFCGQVVVVGCEPATVEYGIGLSPPVAAAVGAAVKVIGEVVAKEWAHVPGHTG